MRKAIFIYVGQIVSFVVIKYLYYLNLEFFQSRQINDNDVVYKFPVKSNLPLPLFDIKNKTIRAFCI